MKEYFYHLENQINFKLDKDPPTHKISSKSANNFLSYVANKPGIRSQPVEEYFYHLENQISFKWKFVFAMLDSVTHFGCSGLSSSVVACWTAMR